MRRSRHIILIIGIFKLATVASSISCNDPPLVPQDRRIQKEYVRVVAFNVRWLFLGNSKHRNECPGNGCDWKTVDKARKHLKAIAAQIRSINADIIQLSEVEDCSTLNELNSNIQGLGDHSYVAYLVPGTDTATSQNVALLTRIDPIMPLKRRGDSATYPVQGTTCISKGRGSKTCSKHFYTEFNIIGFPRTIVVIGLHFIAKPDDPQRCLEREAQATIIARIVKEHVEKEKDVIVLGDFNDYAEDVSDVSKSIPIASTVKIIQTAGELVNVAKHVRQKDRYTNWYDINKNCIFDYPEEGKMIDHILLSKSLYDRVSKVEIPHSSIPRCYSFDSDHFPVIVQLSTNLMNRVEETTSMSRKLIGYQMPYFILVILATCYLYLYYQRRQVRQDDHRSR